MRLSSERKLFLGLKVDAAMKRQIEEGNTKGKPVFKAGDPAHLEMLHEAGELYVGRILDPGFSIDQIEDLKRNIRSIVGLTFPELKPSQASMRLFAIEEGEESTGLAAAS